MVAAVTLAITGTAGEMSVVLPSASAMACGCRSTQVMSSRPRLLRVSRRARKNSPLVPSFTPTRLPLRSLRLEMPRCFKACSLMLWMKAVVARMRRSLAIKA